MSTLPPTGAICPSCGRFVGPLEQCPYCGASVSKRLPLRYLRLGSIALAIVGLAALLYAVAGSATPKVTVANIAATMNYAYVRLEGQVTRGPVYDLDTQELHFYLADSTGEIMVSSFRVVTRQLLAQNKIPVTGDHVTVEGTLRLRDDFVSLNLIGPEKLELTHPAPRTVKIGDIGREHNLQIVSISGDVRDVRTPYNGLTLIAVGDATGEIEVAVYSDIPALTGSLPEAQIGDAVQVNGTVTFYRDSPQIALTNSADLAKLDAGSAPITLTRIGDLPGSRVGTRISVAGDVSEVKKFSQGLRVILGDGSGTITLLLWQDTLSQVAHAEQLAKGSRVQALGKLSEYHGELEVVPARGGDVQIVAVAVAPIETPSPTRSPTPTPAARTIGSLGPVDEDRTVIVSGRISRVSSFSSGMRYTLDDGTGTIILLLWSEVLEGTKDGEALKVGARVQATGKINIFNNALEVVPAKGSEVKLLALSTVPTPAPRTVGSLRAGDVGTVVIIRGTVGKIANFSAGKYVTIGDDTGQIRVTLFTNVLQAMPDQVRSALVEGAKISVRGEVSLYRGELELLPDKGGVTVE